MKRFNAPYPRLGLIVAGVALGLLARLVLGPPDGNNRPPRSIDRPIADGVELDGRGDTYVPINLSVEPVGQSTP